MGTEINGFVVEKENKRRWKKNRYTVKTKRRTWSGEKEVRQGGNEQTKYERERNAWVKKWRGGRLKIFFMIWSGREEKRNNWEEKRKYEKHRRDAYVGEAKRRRSKKVTQVHRGIGWMWWDDGEKKNGKRGREKKGKEMNGRNVVGKVRRWKELREGEGKDEINRERKESGQKCEEIRKCSWWERKRKMKKREIKRMKLMSRGGKGMRREVNRNG